MARQVEYLCNTCGYTYTSIDKIFWIDDKGEVIIKPLVMSTSAESANASVKGFFAKYFCYECQKFVDKFIIYKKSSEMEDGEIIQLLEQSSENSKIIQFDDAFQKCLNCGGELPSKADYSFALDIDGEFHIGEDDYDFSNGEAFKFAGVYHGYFCSKCKKQINKFVITENKADLSDSEIKEILNEHTNDLTIFIRRDFDICPDCGEEVYYLNQNSTCPSCRRDSLTIVSHMMVD
ncbi:hypothetical protein [Methanobrevibacter sp.]|uniref:hypothetical protein n=1 Tax=Methanobrevibacter sp. TaxID=66852 RepID=UPI0026DF41C7|nr:hypothetical protein [Methanobrevibacter sp.]MDO5859327.1 hypothetical protein [Methanobrevibacter sp.]